MRAGAHGPNRAARVLAQRSANRRAAAGSRATALHSCCACVVRVRLPTHLLLPQDFKAYAKLRVERMNARVVGLRAKKAKEAAKEAEAAQ